MNSGSDTATHSVAEAKKVLAAWERPETVEIDLGSAEHANTNSNFDGTNFSS